jgi:cbb3-type cytochrome oxidase maturation protein
MLRASDVAVVQPDGTTRRRRQEAVAPDDLVLVGTGERIGVDGVVAHGDTTLDASLVTGESLPQVATAGTRVFAGTLNLGAAITVCATATGANTLLAECGVGLGGGAVALFLWSPRSGQYDDMDGAAERVLFDESLTRCRSGLRGRRPEASKPAARAAPALH